MKYFPFFEKVEERFHFKISHFFWHVLTALGGLALLTGVLVLLWGIIPAFKPSVDMPVYPEPVKVSAEEIAWQLMPPTKRAELTPKPPEETTIAESKPEEAKPADPAETAYLAAIESLKVLLPPDKYTWTSQGRWEQTYWERRWVVSVLGIQDRLKSAFQKANADDFTSKKQLLDAYISLVSAFPVEQRLTALKAGIDFSKDDVSTSAQNAASLRAAVLHFTTDNADFVEILAAFGRKNPRDGRSFIEYTNTIVPNFAAETRRPILNALLSAYYSYFNDITRQKEATDLFLGIHKNFEPENQVKALTEYYRLFAEKNTERRRQVARIEENYERAQSEAEATLAERRGEKASYRSLALQVIAGSVVFISLVAMFLVLLSIQRNVRMLRETSGGGGSIR
jgi:hypothetical protein